MFNDQITLLGMSGYSVNSVGDSVPIPIRRDVLAIRQSVRQSEFYQAQATNLRPELVFKIWACEYLGEQRLEFEGKAYSIVRTFEPGDGMVELVCSGVAQSATT